MRGWIGVDLDGTLARYHIGQSACIGEPVAPMIARVKRWLSQGYNVRIFTARVSGSDPQAAIAAIREWCLRHVGQELPVTNVKDFEMLELWDDRAVQVGQNTGEPLGSYFTRV